jgi:serine/threonine protein kinase
VLLIGKTVSHYKIISKLGEGGMGVVYKAEDTRLGRSVALKFLPASLGTQDAAKKRFIHEAKAASSLEHPNICAVYDIGETDDGQMFIAMPHYDGETLQERIARGPLEISDAIDIVTQLASGLAKAHEQGIVHRDIKPGNIFITKDGHVKILDFGLAKLATETRLTKSGTTLGTIAYMSPEQASGGDVDARSDIFSLGAVFYELLTAELPFKGDHEAAIIYGIMHNVPEPLQTQRSDASEGLQEVVERALAKNVDERFESAQQLRDALAGLGLYTGSGESGRFSRSSAASPSRRAVPWIVTAVALLVIVLYVMRNNLNPSGERSLSASPTYTQLTYTGDATDPVIAPDGNFVAYARQTGTLMDLYVQDLGGGAPIALLDSLVFVGRARWSEDSARLLFSGRRGTSSHLYVVPRLGGSVRHLEYRTLFDWSPDGKRIAGAVGINAKAVTFLDVTTGTAAPDTIRLDIPFDWLNDLDWSPSGERLLVLVELADATDEIWTIGVQGGADPKRVVKSPKLRTPRWDQTGSSIYYVVPSGAVQSLWKVGIDQRSGEAQDEPVKVLGGITGLAGDMIAFSVSTAGTIAYARNLVDTDLWLLSTSERQEDGGDYSTKLTAGTARDDWPSISPDGREVAFVRVAGEASNVFVVPIAGGSARQVTFMDSECYFPAWSPDSREIAFISLESGTYQVWKVSKDGGAAELFEKTRGGEDRRVAWAPGNKILYAGANQRNLMVLDPDTGDELPLVENADVGFLGMDAAISPDGSQVAVHWNRKPEDQVGIWIISLEASSETMIAKGHKHPFTWSPDGEWIYYFDEPPTIGRVRTDGSGDEIAFSWPVEVKGTHPLFSMSPDGQHFVTAFDVQTPSDIWLIEDFDPDN